MAKSDKEINKLIAEAESHKIQSVPQIKIEVDGVVKETMIGIQPIEVLLGKI